MFQNLNFKHPANHWIFSAIDPWDWDLYLYEWFTFIGNVGTYTDHTWILWVYTVASNNIE